jgi:glycosyltransferase involved in cell wall biosynthesis
MASKIARGAMSISVSVLIPNHNYARYLKKTIDSVISQSHPDIEIIVIDNGSTDNSREVLEAYGTRIKAIFQPDLGQAQARNNGLSKATGDLIALLDADDYWEPTKIERQIRLISNDYQFVYSGMRQFESDSNSTIRVITPVFKDDCRLYFLKHPSRSIVPGGESSAIFTRSLIDEVGNFNTALNSASGRDFFRRCSAKTNFDFVSEGLLNYRLHKTNMSRNPQLMMSDTAKAYQILFEDPDWLFAQTYRRKCLSDLHWSFFKTLLKQKDFIGAIPELLKSIKR